MKKVEFISFSDVHFHDWPEFGQEASRLSLYTHLFQLIRNLGDKHKCYKLLFSGDLVHSNQSIENRVLDKLIEVFDWFLKDRKMFAISGNHDQAELSNKDNHGPNYIRTLSRVFHRLHYIDREWSNTYGIKIYGIPYVNDPVSFIDAMPKSGRKGNILLMHQTLPGSTEGNGYKLESSFSDKIFNLLSPWGLVLNGHIHKAQLHKPNIITVGSTHQQRTSDIGVRMGCWLIYDDLTYKFVPLRMPKFIYGESDGWNLGIPKNTPKEEVEDPEKLEFHTDNKVEVIVENYLRKKKIKSPSKKKALLKYLR